MKRFVNSLYVLLLMSGCAGELRTVTPHFDPAPEVGPPPPVATSTMFPVGDRVYAQTFHVPCDGVLLEFQFRPQAERAKDASMVEALPLEVRRVVNSAPSWDDDDLLARFAVPGEAMDPETRPDGLVRLNLKSLQIYVRQGEDLAIVLRPSSKQPQWYSSVNDLYEGGALMEWSGTSWYARDAIHSDLIFRVVVHEQALPDDGAAATPASRSRDGGTTLPSTMPVLAINDPMPGRVIAEAMHHSAPAPSPPALLGRWQSRLVPFEHDGVWYVQWENFNGTNRFDGRAAPDMVWLKRLPDGIPTTIFPSEIPPFSLLRGRLTPFDGQRLIPGQGIVLHFRIGSLSAQPGRYRVTGIIQHETQPLVTEAEFDVR